MAVNQKDQRKEKNGGAPSGVKLSPSLTLANAGEVKEALQAALAGVGKITVDATAVTEVDLAGLQLICATHRAVSRVGRDLEIVVGASCAHGTALHAAIAALGFGRDVGCGDHCLCREVARG